MKDVSTVAVEIVRGGCLREDDILPYDGYIVVMVAAKVA